MTSRLMPDTAPMATSSWAVLNVWEWAQWNNEPELAEAVSAFTREQLLPLDQALPPSCDHLTDEFFPAVLQRTRAILNILPRSETGDWLSAYLAEDLQLETRPPSGLSAFRRPEFQPLLGFVGPVSIHGKSPVSRPIRSALCHADETIRNIGATITKSTVIGWPSSGSMLSRSVWTMPNPSHGTTRLTMGFAGR